jgi:beta-galactosidase
MVYAAAQAAGTGRAVLAEHWNWSADARKTIPVEVYTNCDSAELVLNGRSLGEKPVADRLAPVLRWEVPSEAGVVRVIGKRGGKEAAWYELATAGAPQRVELVPDKLALQADGSDLANIEIRVVDADGRRVYGADSTIEVQAAGAGELAAVDSGDPADVSPVHSSHRKAWQGRVLAIVRSGATAGTITVRASAAGLKPGEATVTVK